MGYKISSFDPDKRAAAKQAARDEDTRRLAAGEISKEELRRRNGFFSALFEGDNTGRWEMAAIGGKDIVRKAQKP